MRIPCALVVTHCLACAMTAAAAPKVAAGVGAVGSKPSILFLFSDEMDGRILDPNSPQTKPPLPNLHRLATSGAVFTQTYSQSPQCVPSRSAMMVGLRTDQIEVYDNFVGIASTNGEATTPDPDCVSTFGHDACVAFAKVQKAPPTFIDRLATAGFNVSRAIPQAFNILNTPLPRPLLLLPYSSTPSREFPPVLPTYSLPPVFRVPGCFKGDSG